MTACHKTSASALSPADEEAKAAPREAVKIAQDRVLPERLDQENATPKVYAERFEVPSERSAMASLPASDLAVTASELVSVVSMLDEKQSSAASIVIRMRDPILPQPVVISTTTLPLSPRPAILSDVLGGILAALASALIADCRKISLMGLRTTGIRACLSQSWRGATGSGNRRPVGAMPVSA